MKNRFVSKLKVYALTLVFVLSFFLSITFIAESYCHDCTGIDCTVCLVLHNENEHLSGGSTPVRPMYFMAVFSAEVVVCAVMYGFVSGRTPVSLKVKLSN